MGRLRRANSPRYGGDVLYHFFTARAGDDCLEKVKLLARRMPVQISGNGE